MNNEVLASVGILTYNQEIYIKETIEYILNQTCNFNYEIVIGEDHSTDQTRAVIIECQRNHPGRIRLMPEAPNKGVLANFRDTLKSCTGKYIAFCSGDDYWHDPLKLQKEVDFLEQNPEYGLVHTDSDYYFQQNGSILKNYNATHQPGIVDGDVFEALLTHRFYINALTACYRKELVDQFVDYDEFIRRKFEAEDYPTWLELAKHTKFKYLPDSTATYRFLNVSVSRPSDISRKLRYLESIFKIKQFYIEKYNVRPEIVLETEISYHRQRFDLGYEENSYEIAAASYQFLKEKKVADMNMHLKVTLLRVPALRKTIRKTKKTLGLG
jgi:glycosyltransferase involved in cell wall biosynthesis